MEMAPVYPELNMDPAEYQTGASFATYTCLYQFLANFTPPFTRR